MSLLVGKPTISARDQILFLLLFVFIYSDIKFEGKNNAVTRLETL